MGSSLARFLVHRRWWVLCVLLVVTGVAVMLAPALEFDFTPQAIYAAGDDTLAYSEAIKETFGYEDAVLLIVVEATGDADVLDRRLLEWQTRIAVEFARQSRITEVVSLPTMRFPAIRLTSRRGVALTRLVRKLPVTADDERRAREFVEQNDLVRGTLVSDNLRFGNIVVVLDPEARRIDTLRTIVNRVRQSLDEIPPPAGYQVRISGLAALRLDIVDNLRADLNGTLPLAGAILLIALVFIFRCWSGILLPTLAVGMGLAWIIAVIVLTGEHLTIISNVLPLLLMIIGVSNCVHVINGYAERSLRCEDDRNVATISTISSLTTACALAYATTAIGFASLTVAQSDVLRSFGWQAALGMGLLFVTTIGVHAALLPSFRAPRIETRRSPIQFVVLTAGYFVIRHPRLTAVGSLAIVFVALWLGRNVVVNSYQIETYDPDHPMMKTMAVVDEHLGGILPLEISLIGERPGRLLDPVIYHEVAAFQSDALDRPDVLFARSYVDLHQEMYARRKGDPTLRKQLPPLDSDGAKRIQRNHDTLNEFSRALHYDAFITEDGTRGRILLRFREIGTRRASILIDDLERSLAEHFTEESGVSFRATGDGYLNARRMDRFVRDLFSSLLIAGATMFAIIALLFRSLRIGLISVLPNLTPLCVTLGYMQFHGYEMNAGNVIVFAISLGIAVDDTIHFLDRFRREIKQDNDVAAAIRRTLDGTGRAIVITSLLILAGLAIMTSSQFVPTRRFAELTSVTIAAALLGDLLLLPACLMLLWKARAART